MANGGTSSGKYVTRLPFPKLSQKATEADTFDDFSSFLLSIGKTVDDGNISIYLNSLNSASLPAVTPMMPRQSCWLHWPALWNTS